MDSGAALAITNPIVGGGLHQRDRRDVASMTFIVDRHVRRAQGFSELRD